MVLLAMVRSSVSPFPNQSDNTNQNKLRQHLWHERTDRKDTFNYCLPSVLIGNCEFFFGFVPHLTDSFYRNVEVVNGTDYLVQEITLEVVESLAYEVFINYVEFERFLK